MFTPTPIRSIEDAIQTALIKGVSDATLAQGLDVTRILDVARVLDGLGAIQLLAGCNVEFRYAHGVSDYRTAGVGTLKPRTIKAAA